MTQQICHLLRNKGEQTDKTMMETCPWVQQPSGPGWAGFAATDNRSLSPLLSLRKGGLGLGDQGQGGL